MVVENLKPTIYLPVEIKARELKAKVLLSVLAAEAGFRVYIGSKSSINSLVFSKTSKEGIYFYKGGKPLGFLNRIKRKVEHFVVLDEEMGPALHDIDMYCRRRIYPGTEHLVDRLFVIGREHKQKLESARPGLMGRVHVTGWPRVDLWRPSFNGLYEKEVRSIRSRFGDFILFSSDFGFLSEERVFKEIERFQRIETPAGDVENFRAMALAAYQDFKEFLGWARLIDKDDDFPPLVIRPHPAESLADWTSALSDLKKVKVVFEGDIGPWLYASKGLIHRGCTTAVQSYVAGIPSVYWVGEHSRPKIESLVYRVSAPVHSYDELLSKCREFFEGRGVVEIVDVSDKMLMDEELACAKIITQLAALETVPAKAYKINYFLGFIRFWMASLNEFRQMKGLGFARNKLARAKRKMLGGIHEKEVSTIASIICPDFKGVIIERDFNLVEIDVEVAVVAKKGV